MHFHYDHLHIHKKIKKKLVGDMMTGTGAQHACRTSLNQKRKRNKKIKFNFMLDGVVFPCHSLGLVKPHRITDNNVNRIIRLLV